MDRSIVCPVEGITGGLPEEEDGLDTGYNVSKTPTRRKPRASFSGFSHAMSDLRTLPKRMTSQRKRSPVVANNTIHDDLRHFHQTMQPADEKVVEESFVWDEGSHPHPYSKAPGWLRRCMSTTLRHRRRTFENPSRPATAQWTHNDTYFIPIPATGALPPSLPENNTSGAAARAAAAAQNEMLDYLRKYKKDRKDRKVRGDGESGIGIDTRPAEMESTMARR
ncbi:MAG: hypothetical protein Q9209_002657, partial [Squamulea sp. 1 TL-2023]